MGVPTADPGRDEFAFLADSKSNRGAFPVVVFGLDLLEGLAGVLNMN